MQKIFKKILIVALLLEIAIPSSLLAASSSFTTSMTTYGVDNEAPSIPTGLTANAVSSSQIDLAWDASTDNTGVIGYRIFRDGSFLATSTSLAYADFGLEASTLYVYTVEAFDASFNLSGLSNPASATTMAAPVTPPSGGGNTGQGTRVLISDITVDPSRHQAVLTFKTNGLARSKVYWGETDAFETGSLSEILYGTQHELVLTGLKEGTTYFVRIIATNNFGVSGTADTAFMTEFTPVVTPLPNPSDVKAVGGTDSIEVTWTNPDDNRFNDVLIVRSDIFFPRDQFDGVPVYEGSGESLTDTNVESGKTYYYALFSRGTGNEISSGALASAKVIVPGEIVTPTDPFANLPQASNVHAMIRDLTLDDFEFIQRNVVLVHVGNTIAINGSENLTIRLAYDKVPEILKSIAITLADPSDESKVFPFLLRVNSDKTYYEATLGPLGHSGNYKMSIVVLDYQNQGMKRLAGNLRALAFAAAPSLMNDKVDPLGFLLLLFIILLILLILLLLRNRHERRKIATVITSIVLLVSFFAPHADAAFNRQVNYQGKLTTPANVAVANGKYSIRFKLYTVPEGGAAVWTETLCNTSDCAGGGSGYDNRVQITNGLFSVMLGSTTPFGSLDFNQTYYLGVDIGGSGTTASWDGEMSPRKVIGAVPAAMYAATSTYASNADTLQNITPGQFFRNDTQNATSTSNTFMNVLQSGAGKVAEFFGAASKSVLSLLSNGNVGVGTTTPGSKFAIHANNGETNASLFTIASSTANSTSTLFTVLNNGNVGAGTANPTHALDVFTSSTNNGGIISLFKTSLNDYTAFQVQNSVAAWQFSVRTSGDSNPGGFNFYYSPDGATGWTSPMGITTTGNVGIGTTSPYAKLSVAGLVVADSFNATNTAATSTIAGGLNVAGTGGLTVLQNGGNVGIGTTSPSTKLGVNGAVMADYYVATSPLATSTFAGDLVVGDGSGSSIFQFGNDVDAWSFGMAADKSLRFASSTDLDTNVALTMTKDGYVGIGTTSPWKKFTVQGDMYLTGSFYDSVSSVGTNGMVLQTTGSGTKWVATSTLGFGTGSGTVESGTQGQVPYYAANGTTLTATSSIFIAQNGKVGIGTTSPGSKFAVEGTILASGLGVGMAPQDGKVNIYVPMTKLGDSLSVYDADANLNAFKVNTSGKVVTLGQSTNVIQLPYTSDNPTYFNMSNVGIGTTTPLAKLTVAQPQNNNISTGAFATPHLRLEATGTTNSTGFTGIAYSASKVENYGWTSGALRTGADATTGAFIWNFHDGSAVGTEIMRINSVGNLGLGTTSPFAKLSVAGDAYIGGNLTATGTFSLSGAFYDSTVSAGTNGMILQTDGSSTHWVATSSLGFGSGTVGAGTQGQVPYYAADGSTLTATSTLFISQNGRVGIGTTSPVTQFQVEGPTAGISLHRTGGGEAFLRLSDNLYNTNGAQLRGLAGVAGMRITDASSNTEWVRINSSGYVGIGTTTPSALLDVYGSGGIAISTANSRRKTLVPSTSSPWDILTIASLGAGSGWRGTTNFDVSYNAGSAFTAMTIRANTDGTTANVGIGTTTPVAPLSISGDKGIALNRDNVSYGSQITFGKYGTTDWTFKENYDGGTDRAFHFVDSSGNYSLSLEQGGNVGLGTTSPFAKLSVAGDAYIGGNLTATGTVTVPAWGGTNALPSLVIGSDPAYGLLRVNGNASVAVISNGTIAAQFTGTGIQAAGYGIQNSTNPRAGGMALKTGSVAWGPDTTMDVNISRIAAGVIAVGNGTDQDTSGTLVAANIGVGTTSPWAKLSVQATAGGSSPLFTVASSTSGAGTTTALLVDSYGRVGINEMLPQTALQVNGNISMTSGSARTIGITIPPSQMGNVAGTELTISSGNAVSGLGDPMSGGDLLLQAGNGAGTTMYGAGKIYLNGGIGKSMFSGTYYGDIIIGADRATEYATSNVGIGLAYPVARLDVASNVGSTEDLLNISTTTEEFTYSSIFKVKANGNSIFTGNVGIGTTSPWKNLSVAGDMYLTGALYDSVSSAGTSGMILKSTGTGTQWVATSSLGFGTGSGTVETGTQGQMPYYASNGSTLTATSTIFITQGSKVGIGTTSPAALLDVGKYSSNGALTTVLGRQSEGNNSATGTALAVRAWGTQSVDFGGKMFSLESSFYGDLNSAINFYRGGSTIGGYMTFATNDGTEKMRIDSGGKVGIGTSSPVKTLDVVGSLRTNTSSAPYKSIILSSSADSPDYGAMLYMGTTKGDGANQTGVRVRATFAGVGTTGYPNFAIDRASNTQSYGADISTLTYVNSFTIDGSNGNVGIGTTSPFAKLSIHSTGGGSTPLFAVASSTSGNSTSTVFQIDPYGRVAIGTPEATTANNPALALYGVHGGVIRPYYIVRETSSDIEVITGADASAGAIAFTGTVSNHPFILRSNNQARIYIANTGEVGIGTTTPNDKLVVYDANKNQAVFSGYATMGGSNIYSGMIKLGSFDVEGLVLQHNGNGTGLDYIDSQYNSDLAGIRIRTKTSATPVDAMAILGNGNVGIGTTSPGSKLAVEGTVFATGLGIGTAPQDGRLSINVPMSKIGDSLSVYDGDASLNAFKVNTSAKVVTLGQNSSITQLAYTSDNPTYFNMSNVGIGTTTPAALLDIYGNTGETNGLKLEAAGWPYFNRIGQNGTGGDQLIFSQNYSFANSARDSADYYTNAIIMDNVGSNVGIDFQTGNTAPTSRMFIDLNGNVGIGTTTPGAKLQVTGGDIWMNNVSSIKFFNTSGATPQNVISYNGSNNLTLNPYGSLILKTDYSESYIAFSPQGTERVRIDKNGNVGIGTSSPYSKLSFGNQFTGNYIALREDANQTGFYGFGAYSTGVYGVGIWSGTDTLTPATSNPDMIVTSSGYVGIGTTTPQSKLNIYDSAPAIQISPAGYGGVSYSTFLGSKSDAEGVLQLGNNGLNSIVAGNTAAGGSLRFVVNNSNTFPSAANGIEAMRITNTGFVGLGTSTPNARLQVVDTVHDLQMQIGDGTRDVAINAASSNTTAEILRYQSGATLRLGSSGITSSVDVVNSGGTIISARSSGLVGIGTTNPYGQLNVIGAGWTDQANYADSTSAPANAAQVGVLIGVYGDGQYQTRFAKVDRGNNLPLYVQESAGTASAYTNIARFGAHQYDSNAFAVFGNTSITGNLGIGTTTPSRKLEIADSVNGFAGMKIYNTGSWAGQSAGIELYNYPYNNLSTVIKDVLRSGGGDTDLVIEKHGATKMILTGEGNVGIGTTTPSEKLVVNGNMIINPVDTNGGIEFYGTNATRLYSDAGTAGLWIFNPTTAKLFLGDGYNYDRQIEMTYTPGTTGEGNGFLNIGQTLKNNYSFTHGYTMFFTNGIERMRIDKNGSIGIGTSSPFTNLSVAGNAYIGGNLTATGTLTVSGTGTSTFANGINISSGCFALNNACINIGSGLSGTGSVNTMAYWSGSGTLGATSSPTFGYLTATSSTATSTLAGGMQVAGTAGLNVLQNGNVGIGTTSPGAKFGVAGNMYIGDANGGTIQASKELVLRQDGDFYGSSMLRLRSRTDENGAIFETNDATANLVDFIFKTYDGAQRNIRFESRPGSAKVGDPSFHIGGASPDSPTLAIGDSYAAVANKLMVGSYGSPASALFVQPQANVTPFMVASSTGTAMVAVNKFGTMLVGSTYAPNADTYNYGDGSMYMQNNIGFIGATTHYIQSVSVADIGFKLWDGAQNVDAMVIKTTGNVGVGTTTQLTKLTVYSGADNGPASSGVTPNGIFSAVSSNGNGLYVGAYTNSPYGMWIQAQQRTDLSGNFPIVLNPNGGNVGIGAVNPGRKLEISQDLSNDNTVYNVRSKVGTYTLDVGGYVKTADLRSGAVLNSLGSIHNTFGSGFGYYIGEATSDDGYDTYTPYLSVASGGKVGIGTSSPNGNLDVENASGATISLGTLGQAGSIASPKWSNLDYLGYQAKVSGRVRISDETNDTWGSKFSIMLNGGSGRDDLQERFVINRFGDVGIGTTSPFKKLSVNGDAIVGDLYATSSVIVGTQMTIQNSNILMYDANSMIYAPNGVKFGYWDGDSIETSMKMTSTGKVGIGTTSPTYKLSVEGSADETELVVKASAGQTAKVFQMQNSAGVSLFDVTPSGAAFVNGDLTVNGNDIFNASGNLDLSGEDFMTFNTDSNNNDSDTVGFKWCKNGYACAGSELMRLTESGNLGIGTANPYTQLNVFNGQKTAPTYTAALNTAEGFGVNSYYVDGNSDSWARYSDILGLGYSDSVNGGGIIRFFTNPATSNTAAERMRITASGRVGIGSTSPSAGLDIVSPFNGSFGNLALRSNTNDSTGLSLWTNGSSADSRSWQFATNYNVAGDLEILNSASYNGAPTSPVMTLTSAGKVGIGTTGPGDYQLAVIGPTYSASTFSSYVADGLYGATAIPSAVATPGSNRRLLFGYTDDGNGSYVPRIGFYQAAGGTVTGAKNSIGNEINGDLTIGVGASNSEAIRIQASSGNVVVAGSVTAPTLCIAADCRSSWPSGGGAGGTWATTTSSEAGKLVNYPINSTDVVNIGSNSTTTGKFWFDPNRQIGYMSGNLGIGTTSPYARLSVAGVVVADSFNATNTAATSTFSGGFTAGNSAGFAVNKTAPFGSLYVDQGGHIGINTPLPQQDMRMDIRSDGTDNAQGAVAYAYSGNNGRGFVGYGYALGGTGNNYGLYGVSVGPRAEGTNIGGYFDASGASSNYALITAGGNVGIGNSTPASKLTITGSGATFGEAVRWTGGTDYGTTNAGYLGYDAAGATTAFIGNESIGGDQVSARFQIRMGTDPKLTVMSSGNVGIGTTSPYAKLSVAGQVVAQSFVATTTTATSTFAGSAIVGTSGVTAYPGFPKLQVNNGSPISLSGSGFTQGGVGQLISSGHASASKVIVSGTDVPIYSYIGLIASGYDKYANDLSAVGVVGIGEGSYQFGIGGIFRGKSDYSGAAAYGVQASASSTAGSIGAGVYIDAGSGTGTNYGIYQSGASDANYFAGKIGIGTTSASDKLHVVTGTTGTGLSLMATGNVGSAIRFGDDRDNGDFAKIKGYYDSSTAGTMSFFTGYSTATEKMRITGAGNVGIGTTTPNAPLTVAYSDNNYNQGVRIKNTNTGTTALTGLLLTDATGVDVGQYTWVPSNYANATLANSILFSSMGQQKLAFVANAASVGSSPQDIYFSTLGNNATPQMYIKGSTGNVGIGTTSPASKLDVWGNMQVGTSSTPALYVNTASGKVGIGTNAPSAKLGVSGDGYFSGALSVGVASGGYDFRVDDADSSSMTYSSFENSGQGNRTIMEIGMTSGAGGAKFDLRAHGSTYSETLFGNSLTDAAAMIAQGDSLFIVGNYANADMILGTNNAERVRITAGGDVQVANGALCVDNGAGNGCSSSPRTAGYVYAEGSSLSGLDLAEQYRTVDETLAAGDILMADPSNPLFVKRYDAGSSGARPAILGVVSTQPGVLLGGFSDDPSTVLKVPVALTGRVPVKVSLANGPIAIGDRIAPSDIPGVAVKANASGYIVGIALQAIDTIEEGDYGVITAFVDRSYYNVDSNVAVYDTEVATTTPNYEAKIADLQVQIDSLNLAFASSTITASALSTTTLETIASTTADMLASSTSFVAAVAQSVSEMISEVGDWVINKLTAKVIYAERIETQVAAVSQGIEMTDQATGKIYCMVIKNGNLDKAEGKCGAPVENVNAPVVIPVVDLGDVSSTPTATTTVLISTTTSATSTDAGNVSATTTATTATSTEATASSTPQTAATSTSTTSETPSNETSTTSDTTTSTTAPDASITTTTTPEAQPVVESVTNETAPAVQTAPVIETAPVNPAN